MSELATSIGTSAVGIAAPAAVSAGPSIGAEIGGFGTNSPSFSGLGRIDAGIGTFSINEGPRGPISFGNSTDLFAETRTFTPSLGNLPEGPVSGNIFGEDVTTIATAVDPKPEFSIFDNLEPFKASVPGNEGSIESFKFGETKIIAAPTQEQEQNKEISAVIESLKISDPLTATQLASDLAIVDHIIELTEAVRSNETAARISNIAIETALKRADLFEEVIPQPELEHQPEPKVEMIPPQVITSVDAKQDYEPDEKPAKPESRVEFYVDEDANNARRSDTEEAIKEAFKESADPESREVKGSRVIAMLSPEPPDEEISELVLYTGGKVDGSETERRKDLAGMTFESEEAAQEANERAIAENNAVTFKQASKRATDAEVAKVKSKTEFRVLETQVFPLAA